MRQKQLRHAWVSPRGVARACLLCALSSLGALTLPACEDDEDEDVQVAVPRAKKEKTGENVEDKSDGTSGSQAYSYDPLNKRDPFKTYFDELVLEEQEQESRTELQRFDIDKLRLTAVIVGTATPMAMLEDPTGKGHTVRIGTLVGRRFGIVKQIRRCEVVVQEEFRDFTGKRIPVLKPLRLRDCS